MVYARASADSLDIPCDCSLRFDQNYNYREICVATTYSRRPDSELAFVKERKKKWRETRKFEISRIYLSNDNAKGQNN